MPPVGFEPAIPAGELPQTHALDRAKLSLCLIKHRLQAVGGRKGMAPLILKYDTRLRYVVGPKSPPLDSALQLNTMLVGFRVGKQVVVKVKVVMPVRHAVGVEV